MDFDVPVRTSAVVSLVALIPAVLFLLDRNAPFVALSLVSVALIAASLWIMFSRAEGERTHAGVAEAE